MRRHLTPSSPPPTSRSRSAWSIVNALIADVQADKYLSGIDVSGRSLSQSLISILDGVNGQLRDARQARSPRTSSRTSFAPTS